MKKNNLFFAFLCFFISSVSAQTDTVTLGKNQFAISGNTYSFFQTIETNATWNRSVYIYPLESLRPQNGWKKGGQTTIKGYQLFRDLSRVAGAATTPYHSSSTHIGTEYFKSGPSTRINLPSPFSSIR